MLAEGGAEAAAFASSGVAVPQGAMQQVRGAAARPG